MKINFGLSLAVILAVSSFSTAAFAQTTLVKRIGDAKSHRYTFENKVTYFISKDAFSDKSDAIAFCAQYAKAHLAYADELMVVAASSVKNKDAILQAASLFSVTGTNSNGDTQTIGGLIGWTHPHAGENLGADQDVFMMVSGQGDNGATANLAQLNQTWAQNLPAALTVHAICVKDSL
jgi:hypothetical protein